MSNRRRRIAAWTTGRQDYGILRSTLKLLESDSRFELTVWAGGMHLSPRFGRTIEHIRQDGFRAIRELPFLHEPPDAAADMAAATNAATSALRTDRPDCLLVLGDRSETLAAATAALVAQIPVAHLHGGEETEGAIDNAARHAITKLSHLHLVSHELHARRVRQMGEDPNTVVVVGLPGTDNLYRNDLPDDEELARILGLPLTERVVLVTMHPTTLGETSLRDVEAVAAAMSNVNAAYVITGPNADTGGAEIGDFWRRWVAERRDAVLVEALGERIYWGLLRRARVVLGNSSSGILEAPAAGAIVINVGERQRGRFRYGTVLDVRGESRAIQRALELALSPQDNAPAFGSNEYLSGPAAPRILEALAAWNIPHPPIKQFRDLTCAAS